MSHDPQMPHSGQPGAAGQSGAGEQTGAQGQPPQSGFPPQGGYPPQGGQPQPGGHPHGGQPPGGHPQQPGGYPQQPGGYPQQPGGHPQQPGAYPQQGGYGAPAAPGGYPGYAGGPPSGGTGNSTGKILLFVGAGLALLVVLALVLASVFGGGHEGTDPGPEISTTDPGPGPDEGNGGSGGEGNGGSGGEGNGGSGGEGNGGSGEEGNGGSNGQGNGGSGGGGTAPSGDAHDLGHGISLTPAPGWIVEDADEDMVMLNNGEAVMMGMAVEMDPGTDVIRLTGDYLELLAEGGSDPRYSEVLPMEDMPDLVDVGMGTVTITASGGGGTVDVAMTTVVSVRQSDGLTVVGTLYYDANDWEEELIDDFAAMTFSMVDGQVA